MLSPIISYHTFTGSWELIIVDLNPTRAESLFDAGGNQRVSATEDIYIQANWVDENVYVFPSLITADGKEVPNSVYLGSVTIA